MAEFRLLLSNHEISEDFFGMTDHRALRRSKRRPKPAQISLEAMPVLPVTESLEDIFRLPSDNSVKQVSKFRPMSDLRTRKQKAKCKDNMNNLVLSLAPKFTKLQALSLRRNKPRLQDNGVEAIADYYYDLREMDLSKSLKLTDRSLYTLSHGCPRLTKLNISGSSSFSDSTLAYLTGFCGNLKNLNLCGCVRATSDRALQVIAHNCNHLQTLNLGWCEGVGDKGVISLALEHFQPVTPFWSLHLSIFYRIC